MDTSKVTRVEVIDHTRGAEDGGGRVYTYWKEYDVMDNAKPEVYALLQDGGRTLKVFIQAPPNTT